MEHAGVDHIIVEGTRRFRDRPSSFSGRSGGADARCMDEGGLWLLLRGKCGTRLSVGDECRLSDDLVKQASALHGVVSTAGNRFSPWHPQDSNIDPSELLHRVGLQVASSARRMCLLRAMACALAALAVAMPCTAATVNERHGPIRVGAVSSLSGPAQFPESSAAVRALFDVVNAEGGVRGRRLELIVEDDRGDPAQAKRAAHRLVDEQHVVALVGSASIVDCASNAAFYQQAGVMSLQGTGVEPACFTSSHVVPVNTGPYLAMRNALQYTRTLGSIRPCAFIVDLPGTRSSYQSVLAAWSAQSGVTIAHTVHFNPSDDAVALVQQAVDKRCDTVVHTGVEPMVLQWVHAAQRTNVLAGVPTIFLTPAYTERVAAELRESTLPIYCMAEFEPWSSRSMSLTDWRAVMRRGKVPLSSFSQGGYVAAQVLVRVLRDMEGEITREGVANAMRAVSSMQLSMVGTPFSVGSGSAHNPNRAALPMRLEQGAWRIASPFWVVAP